MPTLIKWILTIYVFSILAWSGSLKAEQVVIDHVSFDQEHFELALAGRVTSTCGVSIKTRMIENQFTEDGAIALIEVVNLGKVDTCALDQKKNEAFDFVIDVRSLGLKPGVNYNLAFANVFSNTLNPIYTVEIPRNSFFPSYSSTEAAGVIAQTFKGDWILVRNINEYTILKTKLDLSKYIGQMVKIEGTEVLHRTGPVFEVDAHDPLIEPASLKGPTMFVFSISAATY